MKKFLTVAIAAAMAMASMAVSAAVKVKDAAVQTVAQVAEKVHDAVFDYMAKAGLVLFAEVKSTQTTAIAAGYKVLPSADGGRKRCFYAEYVNGASTLAIADTIYLGDLPKGARILHDWVVNCSAGTASCTLDIGFRKKSDGTVIDVDGIAALIAVSSAGNIAAVNGSSITGGLSYVTTEVVEVYATVRAAVLAANQKLIFEGSYVQD